jgi:plastocyanin
MSHRRLVGAGAALLLALGVVGPALSEGEAGASVAIQIFQFQPGAVEVPTGPRVTWANQDDITHTVTSGAPGSPDGRFHVRLAGRGTSGTGTFSGPGVHPYFCTRHPSMRGEVVVR